MYEKPGERPIFCVRYVWYDVRMSDEDKKKKVLDFFAKNNVPYRLYEHPAFFTVADAHAYIQEHGEVFHTPGVVGCKNLFLKTYSERSRKTGGADDYLRDDIRYYLYVLPDSVRADLKAFAVHVGEKKVTFGTPEELMRFLGVTPGSVSLCGLINDTDVRMCVYIDSGVDQAQMIHLHPNVNTASLELTRDAFTQFRAALPHTVHVYTTVL